MNKQLLVRLTKKDFRWVYFNGSGKGGQNRNKRANCVRVFHDPSGTMAVAQDQRDKAQNERKAFERITSLPKFKLWLKLESMKKAGQLEDINSKVKKDLLNSEVFVKGENGNWEVSEDLAITHRDVENLYEE